MKQEAFAFRRGRFKSSTPVKPLKILILGGTQFVGKHITQTALDHGHQVTLFNRGKSNSKLFPNVTTLIGDRNSDLSTLKGKHFDVVIDVSAFYPSQAQKTAKLFNGLVDHYIYISTISVYEDFSKTNLDENSSIYNPDPKNESLSYGENKALCEKVINENFSGKILHIRPCVVIGPDDYTGRFPYWIKAVSNQKKIKAPGKPDAPLQLIDVRDLANWTILMAESQETGVYNAVGVEL